MLGFKKAERAATKDNKDVTMNAVHSDKEQQATDNANPIPKKKKFMTREDTLSFAKKLKYAKHGVKDESKYSTKQLPDGIISKAIVQSPIDEESAKIVKTYCSDLKDGNFKDNDFFTTEDKVYKMMKKFYECECGTQEYECNILDITRFINISRRAIFDRPFKDEFFNARTLKKSYFSAKTIAGVNCLKIMAWAATHSYCTGLFLDSKGIFDVIPKTDSTLHPIWNSYINLQDDIPNDVKKLFLFENGVCPYVLQKKDIFCNLHKGEGPTDDVPFDVDEASADVASMPLTTSANIKANQQMDEDYHTAMANDKDPIDPNAKASIKLNIEHDNEKTPTVPMDSSADNSNSDENYEFFAEDDNATPGQLTFGQLVADKINNGNKINPAIVASVLSNQNRVTAESLPDFIKANNEQWANIPRLSKFTSYVKEAGKEVIYGLDAEFPGLIKVQIINLNGDVLRELRLDPCVMYGDTLRVVTTDNAKGDIRRETFIPISNKEIVMNAINGPLTKDQRKTIVDALPRCLGDFRTKYSFLDKIDMRGIHNPGKEDIDGLKFEDWRKLVTNISNILKDKRLPICRMRVSEYKDPDNFQLSCDEKTLCSFKTMILNESSNIEAIQNHFFINVTSDPTKKDQNNTFYTGPNYAANKNKKEVTK